jgi:hypothetical protein
MRFFNNIWRFPPLRRLRPRSGQENKNRRHRRLFNRARFRRFVQFIAVFSLVFSLLSVVSALTLPVSVTLAYSWQPQKSFVWPSGGPVWSPVLHTRPTDGIAFVLGETGVDSELNLTFSNALATTVININDAEANGAKRPRLAFGPDGTAYFVWRHVPSGAGLQAYFRKMLPGGTLQSGYDLGTLYQIQGGAAKLDLPDLAVSAATGKLYLVGQVETGNNATPSLGFAQSSDGGASWTNFQLLVGPGSIAPSPEIAPRICVDPASGATDNLHVFAYWGGNAIALSRIGGTWTSPVTLTNQAGLGFIFNGQHEIACAGDGYAYAAFTSVNSTKSDYSTGLARYTPGAGWALVNRTPGQPYGQYDIWGPAISGTWAGSGIPGIGGSAVTITPDNRVWVVSGVNAGPNAGALVGVFSQHGTVLDTTDHPLGIGPTNQGVQLAYAANPNQMYVLGTYKEPATRQSLFSYTQNVIPPTPTPTLAPTATLAPTTTATLAPTATPSPSPTATQVPTATPQPSTTLAPTATPSASPTAPLSPTATTAATATAAATASLTPTATATSGANNGGSKQYLTATALAYLKAQLTADAASAAATITAQASGGAGGSNGVGNNNNTPTAATSVAAGGGGGTGGTPPAAGNGNATTAASSRPANAGNSFILTPTPPPSRLTPPGGVAAAGAANATTTPLPAIAIGGNGNGPANLPNGSPKTSNSSSAGQASMVSFPAIGLLLPTPTPDPPTPTPLPPPPTVTPVVAAADTGLGAGAVLQLVPQTSTSQLNNLSNQQLAGGGGANGNGNNGLWMASGELLWRVLASSLISAGLVWLWNNFLASASAATATAAVSAGTSGGRRPRPRLFRVTIRRRRGSGRESGRGREKER